VFWHPPLIVTLLIAALGVKPSFSSNRKGGTRLAVELFRSAVMRIVLGASDLHSWSQTWQRLRAESVPSTQPPLGLSPLLAGLVFPALGRFQRHGATSYGLSRQSLRPQSSHRLWPWLVMGHWVLSAPFLLTTSGKTPSLVGFPPHAFTVPFPAPRFDIHAASRVRRVGQRFLRTGLGTRFRQCSAGRVTIRTSTCDNAIRRVQVTNASPSFDTDSPTGPRSCRTPGQLPITAALLSWPQLSLQLLRPTAGQPRAATDLHTIISATSMPRVRPLPPTFWE